jgi:hypothetical protein
MANQIISFVNPIDPVQQQIALEQVQRQQALADALRQKSLTPLQGNGGAISPWQGISQLADAIAANHINRKAQAQQYTALAQGANQFAQAHTPSGQPVNLPYDMTQNPYQGNEQGRNVLQRIGDFVSGGAPVNHQMMAPSQGAPQPPMSAPTPTPSPQIPPQMNQGAMSAPVSPMPQQPPQLPAAVTPAPLSQGAGLPPQNAPKNQVMGTGALSFTGDPARDTMLDYANHDAYTKAMIDAHSPTDFMKTLAAAGIDPNSPLGHQILQANVAKTNRIPIESTRPGAPSFDPNTNTWRYSPKLPDGSMPVFDNNGNIIANNSLPGNANVLATNEGATAGAAALHKPIQIGVDSNGQAIFSNAENLARGGSMPNNQPARTNGRGAGPLDGMFGGRNSSQNNAQPQATMGPAQKTAFEARGAQSSQSFASDINRGQISQNDDFLLQQIGEKAKGINTGPGATLDANIRAGINRVTQDLPLGLAGNWAGQSDRNTRIQEIQKTAALLGLQQSSSGAGKAGRTDMGLATSLAAIPDAEKTPEAIQQIVGTYRDNAAVVKAQGRAAGQWSSQRGNDNYPAFQAQWAQTFNRANPVDISVLKAGMNGPDALRNFLNNIPQSQRLYAAQKAQALHSIGAF